MIAALYVEANGVYSGRDDVDCWGIERDARKYEGPWPAVAHPPGRLTGGPLLYMIEHAQNKNSEDHRGRLGLPTNSHERGFCQVQSLGFGPSGTEARNRAKISRQEQGEDQRTEACLEKGEPGKAQRGQQALEAQCPHEDLRLRCSASRAAWQVRHLRSSVRKQNWKQPIDNRPLPFNWESSRPSLPSLQYNARTGEGQAGNSSCCGHLFGEIQ